MAETKWSYKISKPFQWESAADKGAISRELRRAERFYRDKVRFYTFWLQIERLKMDHIDGAFAELGVYKGETARIIHLMDPSRKFHLFDTFTGFAKEDLHTQGENTHDVDFSDTSVEQVRQFISGNENVIFHPGHFPETADNAHSEKFALVHLDADLYAPTLAGLQHFYPRLHPGGIIIVHDYNHNWDGVTKAVNEFASTISETVVPIADWQGSVMIVKSKRGT
jgi:O-methyltransferase